MSALSCDTSTLALAGGLVPVDATPLFLALLLIVVGGAVLIAASGLRGARRRRAPVSGKMRIVALPACGGVMRAVASEDR